MTRSAFAFFPTFGFLGALFPGSCNLKQGLFVRGSHRFCKPHTISRVLPIFLRIQQRRLLSPPEGATSRTGTSFFNNFVRKNCTGTKYRDADLPLRPGRALCRHFVPSITVDMPRNASGLPNRPQILSIKPGSLIWPRRLRSLPTKTRQKVLVFREADPLPHYAGCLFFAASAIDYFQ